VKVLVSACLLGLDCRYCGTGKYIHELKSLSKEHQFIPVCPEQLGGLPTPRNPVELREGRAVEQDGTDRTEQFSKGAAESLKLAEYFECKTAILKANSPSCGYGQIYDGTFNGKLKAGKGLTSELLHKKGIKIFTEESLDEFIAYAKRIG
jgi:uncharacterized protein YbbK (DUF523 family)